MRSLRRRALALVLASSGALGCDGRETLPARLESIDANCVVIVIDAAAAAHFPTYGYARETTPRIAALAQQSVVFERAYAQAPSTSPSVPSYLTGLYPHALALRLEQGTASATRYLPDAFARRGFRTAGFSGNPIVELAIPGDTVFEHFVGSARRTQIKAVPVPSKRVVEQALEWVDGVAEERFFLYVHLLPPHGPYTPPEEHVRFRPPDYDGDVVPDSWGLHAIDRGRRQVSDADRDFIVSQYDANLHYADTLVGQVLDGLEARGLLERSVVILLSDHGEAFGQHGRWVHNSTLYDEMIRVPFIVSLPDAANVPPRRARDAVALVDLAPTVAAMFGLEQELVAQSQGSSLLPVIAKGEGAPTARMIFSQNPQRVAAIRGAYKLILSEQDGVVEQELYRLADDPSESVDLADEQPAVVEELRDAIGGFLDAGVGKLSVEAAAISLSKESERQLNALGYLMPTDDEHAPPARE